MKFYVFIDDLGNYAITDNFNMVKGEYLVIEISDLNFAQFLYDPDNRLDIQVEIDILTGYYPIYKRLVKTMYKESNFAFRSFHNRVIDDNSYILSMLLDTISYLYNIQYLKYIGIDTDNLISSILSILFNNKRVDIDFILSNLKDAFNPDDNPDINYAITCVIRGLTVQMYLNKIMSIGDDYVKTLDDWIKSNYGNTIDVSELNVPAFTVDIKELIISSLPRFFDF